MNKQNVFFIRSIQAVKLGRRIYFVMNNNDVLMFSEAIMFEKNAKYYINSFQMTLKIQTL